MCHVCWRVIYWSSNVTGHNLTKGVASIEGENWIGVKNRALC